MRADVQQYDDLVQRLSTAILAREMGRDELADSNVRAALEIARNLASDVASDLLSLPA